MGEPNMGNERGSSSSSRKGKKSNSEKPKQPQRGLGVAQLEKIRLHEQMTSTYHHGPYLSNFNQEDMRVQSMTATSSFSYSSSSPTAGYSSMMGIGEYDQKANISYGDSQPSTAASGRGNQQFAQPNMARRFLSEDLQPKRRRNSSGSSSQNSESNETQELDLELKLSLY